MKDKKEICSKCGKIIPVECRACPDCYGKNLPDLQTDGEEDLGDVSKYCTKCGTKFFKGSKYCQRCGKAIKRLPNKKLVKKTILNVLFDFIVAIGLSFSYGIASAFIAETIAPLISHQNSEGELYSKIFNYTVITLFFAFVVLTAFFTTKKKVFRTVPLFLVVPTVLIIVLINIPPPQKVDKPADSAVSSPSCNEQQTLQSAKLATTTVNLYDKKDRFIGHGSGIVIDTPDKNLILTNHHVIEDSPKIKVWIGWDNKGLTDASFYAGYPDQDIAIIKVDYQFKYYMPLINSDNLTPAETLYAIGWPNENGGEATITKGIFSRRLKEDGFDIIQTDASINPGNSGGPLVNKCGVVGMNTAKLVWSENDVPAEGTGYALSTNYIKSVIYKK